MKKPPRKWVQVCRARANGTHTDSSRLFPQVTVTGDEALIKLQEIATIVRTLAIVGVPFRIQTEGPAIFAIQARTV